MILHSKSPVSSLRNAGCNSDGTARSRTEAALHEGAGTEILRRAIYACRDHLPLGAKGVSWIGASAENWDYCVGAKNWERYRSALKFSLIFAFSLSTVLTLICYLFAGQIVSVFLTDAAAYDYGVSFAHILLCTSFLFGVFYVLTNALQARGAATESLIVNISRQGLIYIPSMFILGAIFHETGLIWAQSVADVLSLLLALVLYMRNSKRLTGKK